MVQLIMVAVRSSFRAAFFFGADGLHHGTIIQ